MMRCWYHATATATATAAAANADASDAATVAANVAAISTSTTATAAATAIDVAADVAATAADVVGVHVLKIRRHGRNGPLICPSADVFIKPVRATACCLNVDDIDHPNLLIQARIFILDFEIASEILFGPEDGMVGII